MEPTRLIVAPWAALSDLPEKRPTAYDPDYEELLWQASEMLYLRTGRQFSGVATRELTLASYRSGRCWTQTEDMRAASWPAPRAGLFADAGHRRDGWRTVQLPDPPVVEVESVSVDDAPLDGRWAAQLPVGFLHRTDGREWPARGVRVRYRHGLAPPSGGSQTAILLTMELARAWAGDKDCRLPRRLQTITREGVSMSFSEQFEQIDRGRFGIFEVDSWISGLNPHNLQRRARVWTPDTAGRKIR